MRKQVGNNEDGMEPVKMSFLTFPHMKNAKALILLNEEMRKLTPPFFAFWHI